MSNWEKTMCKRIEDILSDGKYLNEARINLEGMMTTEDNKPNFVIAETGKPLILLTNHNSHTLLEAFLSRDDIKYLESGEVSVEDYLNSSYFFFGHFWPEGNITGAYWKKLDDIRGLHNSDEIKKFLCMEYCRGRMLFGFQRTCNAISSCCNPIMCPYNPTSITYDDQGKPIVEIPENGAKTDLFRELNRKVRAYGYRIEYLDVYNATILGNEENCIYLHTSSIRQAEEKYDFPSIKAEIEGKMLSQALYYPEQDFHKFVENLKIVFTF